MTEDKANVFRQDINLHQSTRWHNRIDVMSNSQKSLVLEESLHQKEK